MNLSAPQPLGKINKEIKMNYWLWKWQQPVDFCKALAVVLPERQTSHLFMAQSISRQPGHSSKQIALKCCCLNLLRSQEQDRVQTCLHPPPY